MNAPNVQEPEASRRAASAAPRFVFLDSLRGLAALAVFQLHVFAIFQIPAGTPNAPFAVDFFFCLSGFVVAHAYDRKLRERRMSFGEFAVRRIERLHPMIVLGVALGAVVAVIKYSQLDRDLSQLPLLVVMAALIIPLIWADTIFPLNFPMWSLFFEYLASAVYGLERGRLNTKALTAATAALFVLFGVLKVVESKFGDGAGPLRLALGTARVLYPFAMGALICRSGIWRKAPQISPWILGLALLAMLLAPIDHIAYSGLLVAVVFPVFVVLGANVPAHPTDGLWLFLGRLSYPLYIVHAPILELVHRLSGHQAAALLGVAASIAISWIALRYYDEPLRAWLAARRRRRAALQPAG